MKNMKNKRICWITAPYMLQVDLPILSTLSKKLWHRLVLWGSSVSDNAGLAKTYAEKNDIPLRFIESPYSFYNPMSLIFCCKILRTLKMNGYDAYYLDISTFPWFVICNQEIFAGQQGDPRHASREDSLGNEIQTDLPTVP